MSIEKPEFSKKFAIRLAQVIDDRKLTAISRKIGCSRSLLSKYLSGDLPEIIRILSNLGKEYSVDLHWLLTGNLSPGTAEAAKELMPFIYDNLIKTISKIGQLENTRKELQSNKQDAARLRNIEDELEELHHYYTYFSDTIGKIQKKYQL
jgi:transcriptional regulator with XRE-family HTH domain